MWKCAECGETSEDNFDSCWSCGTGQDGTSPVDTGIYTEQKMLIGLGAYSEQQMPTGPAFDNPCPICAGTNYAWDDNAGQRILERRCNDCGNVQWFERAYLLHRQAIMTLSSRGISAGTSQLNP
jgi:hypothetical protein